MTGYMIALLSFVLTGIVLGSAATIAYEHNWGKPAWILIILLGCASVISSGIPAWQEREGRKEGEVKSIEDFIKS